MTQHPLIDLERARPLYTDIRGAARDDYAAEKQLGSALNQRNDTPLEDYVNHIIKIKGGDRAFSRLCMKLVNTCRTEALRPSKERKKDSAKAEKRVQRRRITARIISISATCSLGILFSTVGLFAIGVWRAGPEAEELYSAYRCSYQDVIIDSSGLRSAGPSQPGCGNIANVMTTEMPPELQVRIAQAFAALEGPIEPFPAVISQGRAIVRYGVALLVEQLPWLNHLPFLGQVTRGGSVPLLSAAEAYAGNNTARLRANEKIRSIIVSTRLVATHLTEQADRTAFVAGLPALRGHGDRPVGGLLAMHMMFGRAAEAPHEICIFAAAQGFPLRWNPLQHRLGRETRQFIQLRERAQNCLTQTVMEPEILVIEREAVDAYWPTEMSGLPRLDAESQRAVRSSLRLARLHGSNDPFVTSIDPTAQAFLVAAGPFGAEEGIFRPIAQALSDGACFESDCAMPIAINVAVAEITGPRLLLRAVRTNRYNQLFGPLEFDADSDRFVRRPPDMGQASIGKLALLLIAAQLGQETLCSRSHTGVTDPNGDIGAQDCTTAQPEHLPSVETAISQSLNLAWLDFAGTQVESVAAIHDWLGWQGRHGNDVAFNAVLGMGQMPTPAEAMQLAALLVEGESYPLTAISNQDDEGSDMRPHLRLAELGLNPAAQDQLRTWFAAPIRAGTLSSLAGMVSVPGCRLTHGKTGTNFADNDLDGRHIVVVAECNARRFVVYAGTAVTDFNHSIGQVRHTHLAPAIEAALTAAVQ